MKYKGEVLHRVFWVTFSCVAVVTSHSINENIVHTRNALASPQGQDFDFCSAAQIFSVQKKIYPLNSPE